jgi:hypothetical protein
MDIQAEKAIVTKQIEQVDDLELILAIKHLLGYGLKKQETDPTLVAALEQALRQSAQCEGRPHQTVKQDFRNHYFCSRTT